MLADLVLRQRKASEVKIMFVVHATFTGKKDLSKSQMLEEKMGKDGLTNGDTSLLR